MFYFEKQYKHFISIIILYYDLLLIFNDNFKYNYN